MRMANLLRLTSTMNADVLIVDDSAILRKVMRKAVVQLGVPTERIREAGNGKEALVALREKVVDLILLDLHMPTMNGHQFAMLKAEDATLKPIPFVVVSTEANVQRHIEMIELGALGVLRKPFLPEDLRRMVEDYLPQPGAVEAEEEKEDLPELEVKVLERIVTNSLERAAFVLTDPVGLEVPATFDSHAHITYKSAAEQADIYLSASDGFLRELAASMLGLEEDDPEIDADLGEALSEFANILAGEIVVALGGEEQRFALGIPELVGIEKVPAELGPATCGVSSLGEGLQISVHRYHA